MNDTLIFDKETGNLIINDKYIIKSCMTVEEIKKSNLVELFIPNGETLINQKEPDIGIRNLTVDGKDVLLGISLDADDVAIGRIEIYVDDANARCYGNLTLEEFEELSRVHKEFMLHMCQLEKLPRLGRVRFNEGYIDLRLDGRSPDVCIYIQYFPQRRWLKENPELLQETGKSFFANYGEIE